MVSAKTVRDIYDIIKRHVPDPVDRARMLNDLVCVRGNRSFTDTVKAIATLHDEAVDEEEKRTP